ncbi:protein-glutamine gamma-glutamyltransferase [Alteribacter lacisalsi]|uniref:Protein-glutamine gamma-glutamyltransferase n=1 Tax=Alteribacter lacisalsi TaxID=2045244 RepID=A0A2W0H8L0_9BACI|nr:protein-glutamine gamma-glutamyltransferase [Alteribacter lacisalsi]PYZ98203.1 protein-glutamine gamma-glutamyltransferase [Alteribacter lacisalsi]
MIRINQERLRIDTLNMSSLSPEQQRILRLMDGYREVFDYASLHELFFELYLRVHILRASYLLNESGASFATFTTSFCNDYLWYRTGRGGFYLRPGVPTHIGLNDIFTNGSLYAFECAVAIVIVFYKAVLDALGPSVFNRLFPHMYLFSWEADSSLGMHAHVSSDYIPGDCVYFENPDFNRATPEWRGENAILMNVDLYFGHGIGIVDSKTIIGFLNDKRMPNARRSAFLNNFIVRPNFRYLSQFYRP